MPWRERDDLASCNASTSEMFAAQSNTVAHSNTAKSVPNSAELVRIDSMKQLMERKRLRAVVLIDEDIKSSSELLEDPDAKIAVSLVEPPAVKQTAGPRKNAKSS